MADVGFAAYWVRQRCRAAPGRVAPLPAPSLAGEPEVTSNIAARVLAVPVGVDTSGQQDVDVGCPPRAGTLVAVAELGNGAVQVPAQGRCTTGTHLEGLTFCQYVVDFKR